MPHSEASKLHMNGTFKNASQWLNLNPWLRRDDTTETFKLKCFLSQMLISLTRFYVNLKNSQQCCMKRDRPYDKMWCEVYKKMLQKFVKCYQYFITKYKYTKCDNYYKRRGLDNKMQQLFQSKKLDFNFVVVDQFAMRYFFSMKVFIDDISLASSPSLSIPIINSVDF